STHGHRMGKPPCRDATPPLRPLPSLSSLRPLSSLPSLRSLPAPARTLRQRYRRGQLLAVGGHPVGVGQRVGLRFWTRGGKRRDTSASHLIRDHDAGRLEQICRKLTGTASGHQGSPNPSSTRISPFAGLTEWSC